MSGIERADRVGVCACVIVSGASERADEFVRRDFVKGEEEISRSAGG